MPNKSKKKQVAPKKSNDFMSAEQLLDYVIDNTFVVEIPETGKKIKVKRMSLDQMIELQKMPKEKQARAMLKHAFGFSDVDLDLMEKSGDGIKLAQLTNAVNMAYVPGESTVKK